MEDLYSTHPCVMLVAQPFQLNLHISNVPPSLPIRLGSKAPFGGLLHPKRRTFEVANSFVLATSSGDVDTDDLLLPKKRQPFWNNMSPRAQSAVLMASAMALHFGGYEFARSAALALFTSSASGFSTPAAFPLAMAMVTPLSFVFLMGYTQDLSLNGPRIALRHCTLAAILAMMGASAGLTFLQQFPVTLFGTISLSQLVVGLVFLFQNSYAHLLYTQQWSFLGSIMTPDEGLRWFGYIAGFSSIAAAMTGSIVSRLVDRVGLVGLFLCCSLALCFSLLCAEQAYAISQTHGFDPADELSRKQIDKATQKKEGSMVARGKDLFERVPTLKALFGEVLSFQSLSTILNVCFVTKLQNTIVDDLARASFTGKVRSYVRVTFVPIYNTRLFVLTANSCSFIRSLMALAPFSSLSCCLS